MSRTNNNSTTCHLIMCRVRNIVRQWIDSRRSRMNNDVLRPRGLWLFVSEQCQLWHQRHHNGAPCPKRIQRRRYNVFNSFTNFVEELISFHKIDCELFHRRKHTFACSGKRLSVKWIHCIGCRKIKNSFYPCRFFSVVLILLTISILHSGNVQNHK